MQDAALRVGAGGAGVAMVAWLMQWKKRHSRRFKLSNYVQHRRARFGSENMIHTRSGLNVELCTYQEGA